ncbi:MAG: ROK family protein [Oscillospiraceae bacterium]|nr:ROK family protein [Oscillospiraceae bacterium]
MKYLGIEFPLQNMPELDPEFIPLGPWMKAYLAGASKPISIAVERDKGKITVRHAKIYGTPEMAQADYRFVERYVKFLLWSIGGFRVYILGASEIARRLAEEYVYFENGEGQNGKRWFDVQFMSDVFENGFEIVDCQDPAAFPQENDASVSVGGHMEGCRIGFDAGGSDRKVSAVIDGQTVYSEEVVWHPKTQADPQYHYDEIISAFQTAASKMPRVDGIGVSSAGVFIGNAPMVSSLFIKVPREKEVRKLVHTIFDRAAAAIGDGNVPIVVANDGDVTALAGAMGLGATAVMGMAMGTSEAVGYVDRKGNILGWFNELAFAPVDLSEHAMMDEWSYDIGVGCKYFSQDAVIKLAPAAGIPLEENLTPAEKLKVVQGLMEQDDPRAVKIFQSIGCYLAHTMELYSMFYDVEHMIVLGRVMSGKGGDTILAECKRIMAQEYPKLAAKMVVMLPDEKTRRVGQSVAAASLP